MAISSDNIFRKVLGFIRDASIAYDVKKRTEDDLLMNTGLYRIMIG